ncbi:hypothetical protein GCM10010145_46780 [Streptomyces ruber]|uniref:Uncharacterized protein n=3 Tax=Streptomyces TaxID=1883 RepID=A0A918BJS9_9ACTN|nr:hypothetical protein GCM10010145_46780 [Streptomyces ruber]
MAESARLGLGLLLAAPPWSTELPQKESKLYLDQFRDWKMWAAAKREWSAAEKEFLGFDGTLPKVPVPTLLIAAGHTHATDRISSDLHEELVSVAPLGSVKVIADAKHTELLVKQKTATQAVSYAREFLHEMGEGELER